MRPILAAGRGFTLLELLVATALTLVVVMTATAVLHQMVRVTRRINGTIAMHAAAQLAHERLARETAAMHPCSAVWLVSRTVDRSVELVFMRGKESPLDFPVNPEAGEARTVSKLGFTDLVWSRWHWSGTTGVLTVAESRGARRFRLDNGNGTTRNFWQIPNNMQRLSADVPAGSANMPTWSTFVSVPQPRRETQIADDPATPGVDESESGPQHVLDQNRWRRGLGAAYQTYLAGDLGDHEDLLRNAQPVLTGCTGLRIEVVDQAGVAHAADGLVDGAWAVAGSFVDGGLSGGAIVRPVDPDDRPGVVRIRFTLGDSRTDATFTYSFSCSTPHPVAY